MNSKRTPVKLMAIVLFIVLVAYLTLHRNPRSKITSRKFSSLDYEELPSESHSKNVFLVDAEVDTDHVKFTPRLACAIESAARANLGKKVILMYASLERLQALKYSPLIDALLSYQNVFFDSTNVKKLSIGSPMEELFKDEKLNSSKYHLEHLTDAMKLLVLWKYGGTYIDADIIVRRSFDTVPSNFVCRHNAEFANGVMGFNHEKDGRELLEILMKEFAEAYDPDSFSSNGPQLITRVIKKLCGKVNIEEIMKMKSCKSFHFLKVQECYAVENQEWHKFTLNNRAAAVDVLEKVSESLVVHVWGHFSKHNIMETDSVAPLLELARQFCPRVLQASGDYF